MFHQFVRRAFAVLNNDSRRPDWRGRITALRHIPTFVAFAWSTNRSYACAIVGLRVVRSLMPVSMLWVSKLIIDGIVQAMGSYARGDVIHKEFLTKLIVLELGLALVADAAARAASLVEGLLGDLVSQSLSARLMEHAASLDLHVFEDAEFQDRLERARMQTSGRSNLPAILLATGQSTITLVTLTTALLAFAPWVLVLLAIAVLPSFVGETHFASMNYLLSHRWTPERRRLDYLRFVGASEFAAKEVKLFALSEWLVKSYRILAEALHRATAELAKQHARSGWMLSAISTLAYYAAYAWIIFLTITGHRSVAGVFTLGVLTFLAASFRQSRDLIEAVLLGLSQLYEQALHLNDLFSFLELRPSIVAPANAPTVSVPLSAGIEFRNVGFKYPNTESWAVRHLSFTLTPNHSVAIVGENGAGKTTLAKLIARLYDPHEGAILLDGRDLKTYDVASVRKAIGVIFQDFVRYDMLLRENIGVGEIDSIENLDRIRGAARRSLADTIAGRFRNGYNQMLGLRFDGGVALSGGEWQRIALARAYLRDAAVLILDEPTAALDARAEHDAFARFGDMSAGKISLLISHRFSTVRNATRIIVLKRGEIVEIGTHDELMAAGTVYAELFALQASGYR